MAGKARHDAAGVLSDEPGLPLLYHLFGSIKKDILGQNRLQPIDSGSGYSS